MIEESTIDKMETTAFEKAFNQRNIEITKNMLQQGLDLDVILKITGLEIKFIQSLIDAEKIISKIFLQQTNNKNNKLCLNDSFF
jgi:hypothetical protein